MRIQDWSKVGALVVGVALTLPACTTIDAYYARGAGLARAASGRHRSSRGRRGGSNHRRRLDGAQEARAGRCWPRCVGGGRV
jgi:hypothetical protein